MILLTDSDGEVVLINPEYMIGAHRDKHSSVITMVGDGVTYRVNETPEEIHDAWTGVEDVIAEHTLEVEDCSTCAHSLDGESQPGTLPCDFCVDYDNWEGRDGRDTPEDSLGAGEGTGQDKGDQAEMGRVSGVPYSVPIAAIKGCPSSRGDNDE